LDCLKNGYFGFKIYNDNLLGHPVFSIFAVPVVVISVLIICTILIGLAHKIPFLKKLVG
jgi:hypothetical protein